MIVVVFSSFFLFLVSYFSQFQFLFFNCLILLILMSYFLSMSFNLIIFNNYFFYVDYLSILLIFLTYFIVFSMLVFKYSMNKKDFLWLFLLMFISLHNCFVSNNLLILYIFFEFSLLPLIYLILFFSKSKERFVATMYLFIYTLLGSFFFLMFLFFLKVVSFSIIFSSYLFFSKLKSVFVIFLFMVFLMKMPLYGVHLWLPKAHVEAPLSGSMILAGVLLKLGGFGISRLFMFVNTTMISNFLNFIYSLSMVGGLFSSMICIRQLDLKVLIAFSSVSHMGILLSSLFSISIMGHNSSMSFMLGHGFCSSIMFYMANMFYLRVKTRNLMIFKGLSSVFPLMLVFWFLMILFNMSTPPSFNFFCELFMIFSILKKSIFSIIILLMFMMINVYYNLNLFLKMGQGKCWLFFLVFKENFSEMFIVLFYSMFMMIFLLKFNLYFI